MYDILFSFQNQFLKCWKQGNGNVVLEHRFRLRHQAQRVQRREEEEGLDHQRCRGWSHSKVNTS